MNVSPPSLQRTARGIFRGAVVLVIAALGVAIAKRPTPDADRASRPPTSRDEVDGAPDERRAGRLAAVPTDSDARREDGAKAGAEPLEAPDSMRNDRDRVVWKRQVTVTVLADDTGAPIEGARVRSLVSWKPEDFREATTDSMGRAQIAIPNRGLAFWVRKRGFVVELSEWRQSGDWRRGAAPLDDSRLVTIRLAPGTPIEGRVVRVGTEAGIADAEVYVWDEVTDKEVECAPDAVGTLRDGGLRTDGEGRFEVAGVPPSTPLVMAARAPGAGVAVLRRPPAVGADRIDVVLRLGGGGTLAGTVTLDGDVPAAGAKVYALLSGDSFGRTSPDSRWLAGGEVRFLALAIADASGRYRLDGLSVPARYEVVATGPEYAQGGSEAATLRAAGDVALRDVSMVTPAWIRARGVAPDGSTVPIEDLDLVAPDGSPLEDRYFSGGGSYGGTDPEGSLFTRPPGHWLLLARGKGRWAPARVPIDLAPGEHKVVEVRFASGVALSGRVIGEDGAALEGIDVTTGGRTTYRSARTSADGKFELDGMAEGEVALDVGRGSSFFEPAAVATRCPSAVPVEVRLVSRPNVSGRVEATRIGAKELSGTITTRGWRRLIWPAVSVDGRFRVPQVPAGERFDLTLIDRADMARGTREGLLVEHGGHLDLGVFTFEASRTVSGAVVDGSGAPLANARIRLYDDPRDQGTDANGVFGLEHMPAAPFRIVVYAPDRPPVFAIVDRTGSPTIRCPQGSLVRGDLVSSTGDAAVSGRSLRLVPTSDGSDDPLGRHYDFGTDTLGAFEVRVPLGSYDAYIVERGGEDRSERALSTRDRLVELTGHVEADGRADVRVTLRLAPR